MRDQNPAPQSTDTTPPTPPEGDILPDDPSLLPSPAPGGAEEFPSEPLPDLPPDDQMYTQVIDPLSNGFELVIGSAAGTWIGITLLVLAVVGLGAAALMRSRVRRLIVSVIGAVFAVGAIVSLAISASVAPSTAGMPAWAEESYKIEINDRQARVLADGGTAIIIFNGTHTAVEAPLAADGKLYLVNSGTGIELPPDPALYGAPVYPDVITEGK